MDTVNYTNDTVFEVSHDLRGPLINIRGFSNELDDAFSRLGVLVAQYQNNLPAGFCGELSKLIDEDLTPCISCLLSAVGQLDTRIDKFSLLIGAVNSGQQKVEALC